MRIDLEGIDVTLWLDRDAGLRPGREGLTNPIRTYELTLVEVRSGTDTIPIEPLNGQTFDVYDDALVLVFSGRVSTARLAPLTGARAWNVGAQSWAVRFFETDTGSLDRTGTTESDRESVIAILTDAFREDTFALTVNDDPIFQANSPDWPGIQATGIANGHDYSYMQTIDALRLLMRDMPGVSITVRPDLIVEYGIPVDQAPLALCTFAAPSADFLEVLDGSYVEDEVVGDHRNRLRLGGVGGSEATAVALASVARFMRYLDAPYVNDEDIAAGEVERIAYARLAALRVRRKSECAVIDATGMAPGQLVQVYSDLAGPWEWGGAMLDLLSWYAPSRFDVQLLQYERPEAVLQSLEREMIGPGPHQVNALQLGDSILDYATALSQRVGGGPEGA